MKRRSVACGCTITLLLVALVALMAFAACGTSGDTDTGSPLNAISPGVDSSATPSGGSGQIAFATAPKYPPGFPQGGEDSHIFVVAPDGTGLTDLGKGAGPVAWSPDGTRIAFLGDGGVWVMNADGSGRELVMKSKGAGDPSWSSEGGIVLSNFEGPDVLALVAVNPDGSGRRNVTSPGRPVTLDRHPVWTPDGRIVFIREDADRSTIYSIAADGSGLTVVRPPVTRYMPTSFSLSPDAKWLVVQDMERGALLRVPVDGQSGEVVLVEGVDWMERYNAGPHIATSWSSDGTKIAFASDATAFDGPSALYVMNADGSGIKAVPNVEKALNPAWRPM